MRLPEKEAALRSLIRNYRSLALAISGGVDSTYLEKIAAEEIGNNAFAVTAISPTFPEREKVRAVRLAKELGVRHLLIQTRETDIPEFRENAPDRCYHCKRALFRMISDKAKLEGFATIADGSNLDDLNDHRPGSAALAELGVRSPLRECNFTKEDIRKRSQDLGLETWNLPSFACLASRFPYGTPITKKALQKVERAESALFDLGFRVVRVRHHGDLARIEVGSGEVDRLLDSDLRKTVIEGFKRAGYAYVALDLEGYRMGSMNEVLNQTEKNTP